MLLCYLHAGPMNEILVQPHNLYTLPTSAQWEDCLCRNAWFCVNKILNTTKSLFFYFLILTLTVVNAADIFLEA